MSSHLTKKRPHSNSSSSNSNEPPKILQSRTLCRYNGRCYRRHKCNFLHPKQNLKNNYDLFQEYAKEQDLPVFLSGYPLLFEYTLNTTLLLILFFWNKRIDLLKDPDFMKKQSFINELKEYFLESQENIDMYIESLVDNILLFNRSLFNSTRTFPLHKSLTSRTLEEFSEIVIYRGFSKSYHKYLEYLDSLLFTSEPVISAELCGRSTNISKELDNPVTTSGFIFLVSSIKSLNNVKGKISIPIVNMFLINASRGVIGINSPKQPQLLASPLMT